MASRKVLTRNEEYPLPHNWTAHMQFSSFTGTKQAINLQFLRYDAGLSAPSTVNTHPEHTSFSETDLVGVRPHSHVENMHVELVFNLTKHCWNTDKIERLWVWVIPWGGAFARTWDADDPISTDTVKSILELQYENTDHQVYPIYNGTNCDGDDSVIDTTQPGLTSGQMQYSTFSLVDFWDAKQYTTLDAPLRQVAPRVLRLLVTRDRHKVLRLRIPNASKHANKKMGFGAMIYMVSTSSAFQLGENSDDSSGNHMNMNVDIRFNEWNHDFDHKMM